MVSEGETNAAIVVVGLIAVVFFLAPIISQTSLHLVISSQGEISNAWVTNSKVSPYIYFQSAENNPGAYYRFNITLLNLTNNEPLNFSYNIGLGKEVIGSHTIRLGEPNDFPDSYLIRIQFYTLEKELDSKVIGVGGGGAVGR